MKRLFGAVLSSMLIAYMFSAFAIAQTNTSNQALYPGFVKANNVEKWGYINSSGKFIIRPIYDGCEDFQDDGLAKVHRRQKVGIINKAGKVVVPTSYANIYDFYNGIAIATQTNKHILINEQGKVIAQLDCLNVENFSEGLASFSKSIDGQTLYGYIGTSGSVIVEPKYKYVNSFNGGKALVQTTDNSYEVIDKKGSVISILNHNRVNNLGDGVLTYSDTPNGDYNFKYGYISANGKILINPKFSRAEAFDNGFAVVNSSDNYFDSKVGLINKNGTFVISPIYSDIQKVGDSLYAVSEADEFNDSFYAKKALFNSKGQQLTEFKYYDIEKFKGDYASVSDDNSTYFIDKNGVEAKDLPKIAGNGTLTVQGDLIKAKFDDEISYLSKDGKIIWKQDNSFKLANGVIVNEMKYNPNRLELVYYPQISNLANKNIQSAVNDKLKEDFGVSDEQINKKPSSESEEYPTDDEISYDVSTFGNILIIKQSGYSYPIGAAHGMPSKEYYYIDLGNGKFYTLGDLFKKGSNYVGRMSRIARSQFDEQVKDENSDLFPGAFYDISPSQNFILTKTGITIYYYPYDIGAYSAGFPEFEIPYGDVMDLIDTDSSFWKAIVNSVYYLQVKSENSGENIEKVKDTLASYESNMIDAIDKNDFLMVAPYLYKDSSLYNSQLKLVSSLNKQGITEELVDYSVSDVEPGANDEYYIYVTENITINYPNQGSQTKEFNWVYTAKYNVEKQDYQLSDIEK